MQSLQAGVTGRMPVSFQCTRPKHGVRGGTPICSGAEGTGASRPRTTPVSRATPAQKNRGGADPKPWETDQLPQGRRVLQPAEPLMASIDDPSFGRPINPSIDREELSRTVRAVILAGGEAKNPLTRSRAMPAVPLGSSLMMIDVPISNCMSAGINKIYVLTQFQSHTLNSHLTSAYPPVRFGGPDHQAWVDVLAAQQTVTEKDWYQGSADAVRRNINELMDEARGVTPATEYVILSGAAVYTMDVAQLVAEHRAKGADITIAMHPVSEADASGKGVAKVHNSSNRVLKFEEKPSKASLEGMRREGVDDDSRYLANMGVYVFRREALFRLLSPAKKQAITHIGHHVVPNALAQEMKVYAYLHDGYWHDVSSLKDFYETNLDLSDEDSPIKSDMSVAARGSMLPPAQLHDADITRTIVGDGAVLVGCTVSNSVVGESVYIGRGSVVEDSLLLRNSYWASDKLRGEAQRRGERVYGVGENCHLRKVVVDENTTIGNNVKILNKDNVQECDRADSDGYMIQDGIVVVMRNASIPDNTVI
ncbi:hypothetical protein ACKKBG_A37900 [Auxenochlorella protothecoides x Auxenochlorella symbiontica]|uniref:glucose-1-phosphate adenylyltransferase n=2 Tax=Auxenochlorella protothecoides TaxID=3075 RepID=A0A087SNV0_AUXPR|nr:Glucose-1-phosphate adenylyltransferase small subunit, chloroplastic/amyloplastic [Auxenochlorella protothecoides]KFM27404.1 Glucose-1-phosphate adenylyltransferase small subunit, chloroplastic/amyloplastic [Auxenochlorella protothecoides]RMZ54135.1 hypothetical protein APUTEX25_005291 [Auxenochlorella protothecoides]|eukprot:RMZ54135.1 hypothetical protein APUTEX25_005291 [Auxenochlorella protothecoides]